MELVQPTYSIISFKASELPEQYVGFIYHKWLRSLRFGAPWFRHIETEAFYKNWHNFIESLMKKPDSLVRLAVLTDDKDVLLGFSVSREDVLDYLYVQADHRMQGIAKKIIPQGITTMSHMTQTSLEIWRSNPKYIGLKFNPFA